MNSIPFTLSEIFPCIFAVLDPPRRTVKRAYGGFALVSLRSSVVFKN